MERVNLDLTDPNSESHRLRVTEEEKIEKQNSFVFGCITPYFGHGYCVHERVSRKKKKRKEKNRTEKSYFVSSI